MRLFGVCCMPTRKYHQFPAADLMSVFSYDPISGAIVREGGRRADKADSQRRYKCVSYKAVLIPAHVVAWALQTGEWPDHQIDHKDRDGLNNAWDNLRAATANQQQVNRRSWAVSGFRGVRRATRGGNWWAEARVNGKAIHLGTFATAEAARYREKVWGEFAPAA